MTPCPVCGGILCREMGTFYRCVACRSLLAVTGDYAEVLGTPGRRRRCVGGEHEA